MVDSVDKYVEYKGWHPDTGDRYNAEDWALARALTKGEQIVGEVIDIERFDGGRATILNSAAPIRDDDGKFVGAVVTVQDVTKIKKAENELISSNTELQQFAYVASHDLQEPLRMVTVYLGLLEKKYSDQLDGKAKQYMDFAIDGGLELRILSTTCSISQGSIHRPDRFQPTDMEKALEKVLTDLSIKIKEEHATITHDELPTIMADEVQIMQVLQNLISNAIKFHGDEAPIVHIGCEDMGDRSFSPSGTTASGSTQLTRIRSSFCSRDFKQGTSTKERALVSHR